MLFGRHVNRYYLKYSWLFIIGILALIAVDYIQLKIPEYLGEVVYILDNNLDTSRIFTLGIYVLLVAAGMFVGRFIWRIALFNASFRIEADMRHKMFLKAEALPRQYYHDNKVGSVMSWFTNDLETISDYFGWGTVMIIDSSFMAILTILKMFFLDWIMTLICFIPVILIVIWGAITEKYMAAKWDERQRAYDTLYDFAQENFTGIRVIKAFVKETQELHAFAKMARKDKDTNVNFARVSVALDVIIEIIIAIIIALIMGIGGWFIYSYATGQTVVILGHEVKLLTGDLVAFTGYFDLLIWPMMAMGSIVSMRSRAKTSLARVSHFLDEKEEIHDIEGAIDLKNVEGNITFNDFSFTYPGSNNPSLKHISLEIKAGETIGIVGKIGSGKTTLVNSLLRLYNVDEDAILIDNQDIMKASMHSVRKNIAYVPQDNFLFSDKVENNIAFSDDGLSKEMIEEAAKFSDVHNDILAFKDGYETVSGERGVTLSGGQKQRISIARAYVKKAPIMILDDSVSAVDVNTEEEILRNIAAQRKGMTTLVVASRVSTVSHLDKIIVLNDGELEAFGSHAELMKVSKTYQTMVYLQKLEQEVEGGDK